MSTKFTPGPWAIDWYECVASSSDAKELKHEGVKTGDVFWRMPKSIGPITAEHSHWGGLMLDVEAADAHLVAAAPDLYEALERTLSWLAGYQGGACLRPDGPYDQARAALAKARGES